MGYFYSGGLSLCWWAIYILVGYLKFSGPSVFWWANFMFYLVDMSLFCWTVYWHSVCEWLQVVGPHFAKHTSSLLYCDAISTLDNMTCHRSFITYCSWCDKIVATTFKVINYVQCFMYRVWAYFIFILFIAIDWDNKIHSLLCIYVLMVNNPTSMYTDT